MAASHRSIAKRGRQEPAEGGTDDRLLSVMIRRSPLLAAREELEVPPGLTVAQIVDVALPDAAFRRLAHVELVGEPVPRGVWGGLRPKPGVNLTITVVPAGDTRTWLQVAVNVAAIAALAIPGYGPFISAGILLVGNLAIALLVPPPTPNLKNNKAEFSPTYAIDGGRNTARPWDPVPVLLGTVRMVPPLAVETISETVGNESYLCLVVCWSQGPIALGELKIGETPLSDYDDVEVETVQASPTFPPDLALYPADQTALLVGADLTRAAGWITRRTGPNVDRVVIELQFSQGLLGYGEKTGDQFGQSVTFEVETSPAAASTWTARGTHTMSGKSSSPLRRAITVDVARGQYDVRVRRVTEDSDDPRRINASAWGVLRSVTYRAPITAANRTVTALRIRATAQLSGTVDTLNAVGQSICLDWDKPAQTWIERGTNNPASLFAFVLKHFGRTRFSDAEIDWPRLEHWHERCDANDWSCNLYVDFKTTLWEVLRMVCATGRAAPVRVDGKWSVMIDEPQTVPVQYLTPRNSRDLGSAKTFVEDYHGFRVQFADAEDGFKASEVIVYRDGYDETNAEILPELEAVGITYRRQAWRWGRWNMAQLELRPERYTRELAWEHLVATRGDLVGLQHDQLLIGTSWGRVRAVETAGGQVVAITLDELVVMAPGRQYVLVIRRPDAADVTFDLVTVAVPGMRVELAAGYADELAPAAGDLALLGERQKEMMRCIVKEVRPGPDLKAVLELIPARWADEDEPLPSWDPVISTPAGTERPVIWAVRSDQTVAQRDADGSIHLQLVVALYSDGIRWLTNVDAVQVRWRVAEAGSPWRYASFPGEALELVLPGVEVGVAYDIQARYRFVDGSRSPWSAAWRHAVVGVFLPPPDVGPVYLDGDDVAWDYPAAPPDLKGYLVRTAAVPDLPPAAAATLLTEGVLTERRLPLASVPLDAREVLVTAVATSGLESVNPARLAVTPELFPQRVRWLERDYLAAGFPGAITNGQVEAGSGYLAAIDSNLWLEPAGGMWLDPPGADWLAPSWGAVEYILTFLVPQGVVRSDRVVVDYAADGTWTVERRWAGDMLERLRDDDPLPDWFLDRPDDTPLGLKVVGGEVTEAFEEDVFEDDVFEGNPAPGVFDADVFEDDVFEVGGTIPGSGEPAPTSARDWVPWRQGLRPVPGEVLTIRLRSTGQADAAVRPRLTRLVVAIDAAEISELVGPVEIPTEGLTVPTTRPFRGYSWVFSQQVTSTSSSGSTRAILLETGELPSAAPPRLYAEAGAGVRVAARALLDVGGW